MVHFTLARSGITQEDKDKQKIYTQGWGFPGGSDSKQSAYNTRDPGLIPGLGVSPGEENDNLCQYS